MFNDKAYVGNLSNIEGREGEGEKKRVKRYRLVTAYLLAPAGAPVSEDSLPS